MGEQKIKIPKSEVLTAMRTKYPSLVNAPETEILTAYSQKYPEFEVSDDSSTFLDRFSKNISNVGEGFATLPQTFGLQQPKTQTPNDKLAGEQFKTGVTSGLAKGSTVGILPFITRLLGIEPSQYYNTPEFKKGENISEVVSSAIPAMVGGGIGTLGKGGILKSALKSGVASATVGALQTPEKATETGKWEDFFSPQERLENAAFSFVPGAVLGGIGKAISNIVRTVPDLRHPSNLKSTFIDKSYELKRNVKREWKGMEALIRETDAVSGQPRSVDYSNEFKGIKDIIENEDSTFKTIVKKRPVIKKAFENPETLKDLDFDQANNIIQEFKNSVNDAVASGELTSKTRFQGDFIKRLNSKFLNTYPEMGSMLDKYGQMKELTDYIESKFDFGKGESLLKTGLPDDVQLAIKKQLDPEFVRRLGGYTGTYKWLIRTFGKERLTGIR